MKRNGIINTDLAGAIAGLAHTDHIVIADAGLPVGGAAHIIDLALIYGVPRFDEVFDALLAEIVTEQAWVAEEIADSPANAWIERRLPYSANRVPHEHFKKMASQCRLAVRTGEDTPYANIILQCGIPFASSR